jgi:hypothetical protein
LDAASGVGILLAVIFLIGSAFVIKFPKFSMGLYIVGAILSLLAASNSEFKDLYIWGVVSAVLAVMSYFGAKEVTPKTTPIAAANNSNIATPGGQASNGVQQSGAAEQPGGTFLRFSTKRDFVSLYQLHITVT